MFEILAIIATGAIAWILGQFFGMKQARTPQDPEPVGIAERDIIAAMPDPVKAWAGLAQVSATRHGMSTALILAVIWQESYGDPNATGGAGEKGLMQVTDGAALDVGYSQSSYDPAANIEQGTAFLKLQIDRMGGDLFDGLRAYNAGALGATRNPQLSREYAESVLEKLQP